MFFVIFFGSLRRLFVRQSPSLNPPVFSPLPSPAPSTSQTHHGHRHLERCHPSTFNRSLGRTSCRRSPHVDQTHYAPPNQHCLLATVRVYHLGRGVPAAFITNRSQSRRQCHRRIGVGHVGVFLPRPTRNAFVLLGHDARCLSKMGASPVNNGGVVFEHQFFGLVVHRVGPTKNSRCNDVCVVFFISVDRHCPGHRGTTPCCPVQCNAIVSP